MITLMVIAVTVVYVLESLLFSWLLTLPILTWSGAEIEKGLPKKKALLWGFLGTFIGNVGILLIVGIVNGLAYVGDWMINNLP